MSTRCNIIIKQDTQKACLYRHMDGYPEGAGKEIEEFLDKIWYEGIKLETLVRTLVQCEDLGIGQDKMDIGMGENIDKFIHWDIEYLYVIDIDWMHLVCYECRLGTHYKLCNDVIMGGKGNILETIENDYKVVWTHNITPKTIKNKKMTELETYLALCNDYAEASKAYYKDSKPIMSDIGFDILQNKIRLMLDEHPEFINECNPFATPQDDHVDGFKKVQRTNPMLSLRDIYTREEVETWWDSVGNVPVSVEAKLDGLSLSLIYKDGELTEASTRGTGYEGDDVTAQAMNISNIPHSLNNDDSCFSSTGDVVEVRGEVTMPIAKWKEWNETHDEKQRLANPRNAASGALKTLDPTAVIEKGLQFNAYYMLFDDCLTQTHAFKCLEECGFDTLPHQPYVARSVDEIMWAIENVQKQRNDYEMQIDGVVLKVCDTDLWQTLGNTDKFHKFGIAYKFKAEAMKSKLLRVVWQVADSGRVTPVAEYEPIQMFGTTCQRATLNNMGWIKKNLGELRIGDTLLLTKGGDIIPKITGVEHREPTTMDIVCPRQWESHVDDKRTIIQTGGIVDTPDIIGGKPTRMEGAYLVVDKDPLPTSPIKGKETKSTPITPTGDKLNGKQFYITGKYSSPQRRKDLQRMVVENGGRLQDHFHAASCDYLVCGEKVGQAKVLGMKEYCKGDHIISEEDFLAMI